MIVVSVTDSPPRLRGDLSKWLIEINTGVYVGRVSARVREELWKRICMHLPNGRATMVFSAANEQKMSFYVHNTTWEPADFDGLTLIRRPAAAQAAPVDDMPEHVSQASLNLRLQRIRAADAKRQQQAGYVVIDIETTGLDYTIDSIIELAAVRVINHQPAEQFTCLVKPESTLPAAISDMTGITRQMLETEGLSIKDGMTKFCDFIKESPLVGHNIGFDRAFLENACEKWNLPPLKNLCKDTLSLSRRLVEDVPNYQLTTLAAYFNLSVEEKHRALTDCLTTYHLYEKLNEI